MGGHGGGELGPTQKNCASSRWPMSEGFGGSGSGKTEAPAPFACALAAAKKPLAGFSHSMAPRSGSGDDSAPPHPGVEVPYAVTPVGSRG